MSRLNRPLRLTSALALVAWGAIGAPVGADAIPLPDAVTDVRVEEETAYTWSQVRLHLDWRVPDGTSGGDTFTLRLPAQLAATDGITFPLRDQEGETVANAVVDGDTVTFTMTDYAEDHTGVHGTAWFWVTFTDEVEPGEDLDLVFEVGATTFRDSIAIGVPVPNDDAAARKWQRWEKDAQGNRLDRFLWAVDGPVVQENMVNATYEIVDTAGADQAIDCAAVTIWAGGPQDWSNAAYISRSRLEAFDCSPQQVSITYRPTANEVGRAMRLLGNSNVTDTSLQAYRNQGLVRIWGTAEWNVEHVLRAGGGGDGTGQVPTSPPTDPGVTPEPTDEPTTPEPTDEPTTPEPTDEPTTPVPTDEPTTPVPTDEPTTPGPTTPVPTDEATTPVPTDEPTTPEPTTPVPTDEATTPVPTVTVTQPAEPAPTVTVTQPATPPVVVVPGSPNVTVTVPAPSVTVTVPTQTVTVSPGAPVPTSPGTIASPTDDDTLSPGAQPVTDPVPTVVVPADPVPTATVTVPASVPQTVPGTTTQGVTTQGTQSPTSPARIDTGVPEGIDVRLAGAGGGLALISGVALIALSRRRGEAS